MVYAGVEVGVDDEGDGRVRVSELAADEVDVEVVGDLEEDADVTEGVE